MSTVFSAEDLENLRRSDEEAPPQGAAGKTGAAAAGSVAPSDAAGEPTAAPVTPAPAAPAEFRYGEDAPEELRGKTPAEAAAIYMSVREVGRQAMQGLQQLRSAPPTAAPPQQPSPEAYRITGDDLMGSNAETVNQKLDRLFEAKAAPLVNQIWQGLGALAFMQARNSPALPYFQRYEQEITAIASRQPSNVMMNPMAWESIYKQVVASHQNEIVEEEVRKRLQGQQQQQEAQQPPPGRRREIPFSESGGRTGSAEPAPVLAPEILTAARALGVDPTSKDFLELAKQMEAANG